ncbi:MAG: hypothetical protein ISR65_12400 [Bacteriovoracaceae bacterium]|nr:hypothetical protein [Bacteriovoracaceae bacterium]
MKDLNFVLSLIVLFLFSPPLFCKTRNFELSYPELNVTPRASERLRLEAINERRKSMGVYRPIQISALMTMIAGISTLGNTKVDPDWDKNNPGKSNPNKIFPYVGIGVGLTWIAGTYLMGKSYYRPYQRRYGQIKNNTKLKGKSVLSKRLMLLKERMAEEAISDAASVGVRLVWMSIISNAVASGLMASAAEKDSVGQILSGLSVAISFAPLIFSNRWRKVYWNHQKYKKRIYAPVASGTILFDPVTKKTYPGVMVAWNF